MIKVEDPSVGGDVGRDVPPYAHGEDSLCFETSPVRVGHERPSYRRAPRRNEDADHVLGTVLGHDSARIEQLNAAGAFGS